MDQKTGSKIRIIISMVIFGTIGVFRKYIPLSSSLVAFSRALIGTLFIIALMVLSRKKIPFAEVKKDILPLLLSGSLLGFNWILLFESYRYTSVAVSTICYYMAPVFIILLSPFIFKEAITPKKRICILFAFIGISLVSGIIGTRVSLDDMKGILYGLIAASFYATVVIINKKTSVSGLTRTLMQLMISTVVMLPYILFTEDLSAVHLDLYTTLITIFVGIVHTGIAYALYFGAVTSVDAQSAALLSYIDPIIAIILSVTLLKEGITIPAAIGAVMVIGAMISAEIEN